MHERCEKVYGFHTFKGTFFFSKNTSALYCQTRVMVTPTSAEKRECMCGRVSV